MVTWKNKNLIEKASYSLNGFLTAFASERAIKLETLALVSFTALAIYRGVPAATVLAVFLSCLLPLTAELINTSVELIIDLLLGTIFREDVRRAKDMLSASVVLSLCIGYGFALKFIFF